MKRTPGDIIRRRNIADAASGFPSRATVVLYACIAPGQNEQDIIGRLRRHAEARDWVVVAEVVDDTPATTPLGDRPGWPAAQAAIASGRAKGIVTTACAETPDTAAAGDWLREHQAFFSQMATTPTATREGVSR